MMVEKNVKTIENARKKKEVVGKEEAIAIRNLKEDIIAIGNLKSLSKKEKDKLIQDISSKKELVQWPIKEANKGYNEVRKKLSPEWQKQMRDNIRIGVDGKIEIIKMKKRFSILTSEDNGNDVVHGEIEDEYKKTGIKWVTYLTGKAAENASKEQKKKLLKDEAEIQEFINYFPWETMKEKIDSFVQLFGLEKAGSWDPNLQEWMNVGSVGYVGLSSSTNVIHGMHWVNDYAFPAMRAPEFPIPWVAYEDC